jgi:L-seryl-tRNA(Ser) seleniumtransferase
MTSPLPSVDALLRMTEAAVLQSRFGRTATLAAIRAELGRLRAERRFNAPPLAVLDSAADALHRRFAESQRAVFNLTGTVLHTNLGRAPVPPEAAEAAARVLSSATSLEFDLKTGRRGERDDHVRGLIRELTGAEDATVVNNNAAAVLLILNTLALGREVPVSRGELVEIGGSFRMPEIMARAGAKLVEVGTTNRTHPRDYRATIRPETALLLRVHPSNYAITGFTASAALSDIARIAHEAELPCVDDLGSGSLVDLSCWSLPREPMPQESLREGADLVCFSGDKLLGGPQAGLVIGRAALIARLNANPMKRALRLDKARMAALEHVLRLYLDPDRLAQRLPALRLLSRPASEIRATAERMAPLFRAAFPDRPVAVEPCKSQIGSGALPIDLLPSFAVTIGSAGLEQVSTELRGLPQPVIGRIAQGRVWLDCRCLEPEAEPAFAAQLAGLRS